jgi:ribulose-5-phosphate 4-epimerase/fuculose-1-phosphate aldolase
MSEAEWQTRLDLAACYRLVDLFGWSDLVNTRITARVPGQHDHFLINPYGLLFDEVTASSLVKIDAEGNKVEPSDSVINRAGSRYRARSIWRAPKSLACSTPIRLPAAPYRCKELGCCRSTSMPCR